jgi:hypothetical protein
MLPPQKGLGGKPGDGLTVWISHYLNYNENEGEGQGAKADFFGVLEKKAGVKGRPNSTLNP